MTFLKALRPNRSATDTADAGATGDTGSPIAGYDRLDARHVVAQLARHSQQELATIETYERSHGDRPEVLHKLRYLRGREPLPGYDTLEVEQISTALDGADLDTAKRVREYERKFKRRANVLDAVTRTCAARQSTPSSISERRDHPAPASG
jgi:hypothetical protein